MYIRKQLKDLRFFFIYSSVGVGGKPLLYPHGSFVTYIKMKLSYFPLNTSINSAILTISCKKDKMNTRLKIK